MIRALAAVLALAAAPVEAQQPCRLALALALDVSGSVDAEEYRLQTEGLAAALSDPEVAEALLAMPGAPVALSVYEWSASSYQRQIHGWTLIGDAAALGAFAARVAGWRRGPAPEATGLGAALAHGRALIDRGPACWERTLDVSGDGKNNDWPTPRNLRILGTLGNLRVNALVIVGPEEPQTGPRALPTYFRERVIQGPGAFVEIADGFHDYERAMKRKLLKELATRPVGALSGPRGMNLHRF